MTPFFSRQLQAFVIDEMCECGHSRKEHGSLLKKLPKDKLLRLPDDGNCCSCACSQFTWKGWITADQAATTMLIKRKIA